ncbi:hypothetical protein B0O99DRAFT_693926 [Bisporella sp. PMI_857]|nr:hypothetical protein B0O99DRAFT_693926 [Bisporella sp. PMI_857]
MLYRRALGGRAKILGQDYPSTLECIYLVGLVLAIRNQCEAAQHFQREALAGKEKVLGETEESVMERMADPAFVLGQRGQHREAKQLYKCASLARAKGHACSLVGQDGQFAFADVPESGTHGEELPRGRGFQLPQ